MPEFSETTPDEKDNSPQPAVQPTEQSIEPPIEEPRTWTSPVLPPKYVEVRRKKRKTPSTGKAAWWPVAAGVALGCLAPLLRLLLAPCDPWGMRIVFPFVLLAGHPEFGLSEDMARVLPQWMLFAQFPLEGLATKFFMSRGEKTTDAIGQLIFVHGISAMVLWLVSRAV
jgi:hypothetical protein